MKTLTPQEADLMNRIWERGRIIEGISPTIARKDACGAWIYYRGYNDPKDPYGWGIDHINPALRNSADEPETNLRPLHILNIVSKGDSYPIYTSAITSDGIDNIRSLRQLRISLPQD